MGFHNAAWFRKRIDDALALRWKGREGFGMVMCGPDDIEMIESGIASGAEVCATEEDYTKYDEREKLARSIFAKAARILAPKLPTVSLEELETAFDRFLWQFREGNRAVARSEHTKEAKNDLQILAEKACGLAVTMLELGEGAKEILARNRYPIGGTDSNGIPLHGSVSISEWQELKEYGDLFEEQTSENSYEMSFTPPTISLDESEAFNFPWVIPYDSDRYEHDDGLHDYEWSLGGPWIIRLRALAELAAINAEHLGQVTGKGGRKNLGSRLHGSPDEYLAQACREFAEAHGCKSQAVVLKMVQAVMEAEHGKEAMKKMDGKPSKDKGRKAVRKVAQTKSNNMTDAVKPSTRIFVLD